MVSSGAAHTLPAAETTQSATAHVTAPCYPTLPNPTLLVSWQWQLPRARS